MTYPLIPFLYSFGGGPKGADSNGAARSAMADLCVCFRSLSRGAAEALDFILGDGPSKATLFD